MSIILRRRRTCSGLACSQDMVETTAELKHQADHLTASVFGLAQRGMHPLDEKIMRPYRNERDSAFDRLHRVHQSSLKNCHSHLQYFSSASAVGRACKDDIDREDQFAESQILRIEGILTTIFIAIKMEQKISNGIIR